MNIGQIDKLKMKIIEQIVNINSSTVNSKHFTIEDDVKELKKLLRD